MSRHVSGKIVAGSLAVSRQDGSGVLRAEHNDAHWDRSITGMVNDLSTQAGLNQTGMLTTFANDVAQKFGANVNTSGQPATQPDPATNESRFNGSGMPHQTRFRGFLV